MSKSKLWLGIAAISLMSGSGAIAADMAAPIVTDRRVAVVEAPVDCIRWVRQNQSWYNYCDPVPHFPRTAYGDFWWDYRWYGNRAARY